MIIVEKNALTNGAHRNQMINGELRNIPEGWVTIPDGLEDEAMRFMPFIELTFDENGKVTAVAENKEARLLAEAQDEEEA